MASALQRLRWDRPQPAKRKRIRALVSAESIIALGGLCLVLGTQEEIEVVGTAADGVELLEKAVSLQPDLIVSEVSIPRLDGLACASCLRYLMPGVRIILLTGSNGNVSLDECLRSGADACLKRAQIPEGLLSEIRSLFPTS